MPGFEGVKRQDPKQCLRYLDLVKKNYKHNRLSEAIRFAELIQFPPFQSEAFHTIFPKYLATDPEKAINTLNFITEPAYKETDQIFACVKLNQRGLVHLVDQIARTLNSTTLKKIPFVNLKA